MGAPISEVPYNISIRFRPIFCTVQNFRQKTSDVDPDPFEPENPDSKCATCTLGENFWITMVHNIYP